MSTEVPNQSVQQYISEQQISASLGWVTIQDSEGNPKLVRYDTFVAKLFKADSYRQMFNHAVLGVCGEAGELADAIKKHVHYGKALDRKNVLEELGDLRFYLQAVMNLVGISETEILQHNCDKLSERYKNLTYSDKAAIERADKVNEDVKSIEGTKEVVS